jgi:voltage-gated sodium channel
MMLEGWVEGVVNPIMEKHPYAWLFFIPFIIITTFWVLNLFIGIIVNAMQEEHAKAEAEERKAERGFIHDETAFDARDSGAQGRSRGAKERVEGISRVSAVTDR